MLNSKQYRVKVAEYKERGKKTDAPNEIREIKNLGRTFTEMADIFGPSDNAVIRLRVLRVSQAPGSSMSACHGKHRAVDLLARSRDHSGRPDGGSEQRHESCELSRRGCSKMPTLRFRDQEIAKLTRSRGNGAQVLVRIRFRFYLLRERGRHIILGGAHRLGKIETLCQAGRESPKTGCNQICNFVRNGDGPGLFSVGV
jgi:hypothetical protein